MNRKFAFILMAVLACNCLTFCGEIHDTAEKGDLEKVKALLKEDPNLVFSKDNDGNTPLHSAVKFDHKDVAEFLLANKADVDAKDKWNDWTSLHIAAVDGYKDEAELLLANKADVNAQGKWNITPLLLAAGRGYTNVAELLLAHGADVKAKDNNGWTALHVAAMGGQKNVAELLLANGADVNARNNKGETPLQMVLALATDSRYKPETEMGKRNVEMVKLLVASHADVNTKDNNGSTPLDYPASNFRDFGNLLRQHGATNNFH